MSDARLMKTFFVGFVETNPRVDRPQHLTVNLANVAYIFYYEWNEEKQFIVLTIKRSQKIIFRSKLLVGGEYIVHAPRFISRLFKIKTVAVIYPLKLTKEHCILRVVWQEGGHTSA